MGYSLIQPKLALVYAHNKVKSLSASEDIGQLQQFVEKFQLRYLVNARKLDPCVLVYVQTIYTSVD